MSEERKQALRKALRAAERAKYGDNYFRDDYWKEDLPGHAGNRGLSYEDPEHAARFGFLASLFAEHFPVHSYVDIGCGPGLLLVAMHRLGICGFGCDASVSAIRSAIHRGGCQAVVAGVEAIPLPARYANLVICSDVLEHVPVFDLEDATADLVRISNRWVVATINLDNPYRFHPSVLSRDSWDSLFLLGEGLALRTDIIKSLHKSCSERYPEYDFFVYEREGGRT